MVSVIDPSSELSLNFTPQVPSWLVSYVPMDSDDVLTQSYTAYVVLLVPYSVVRLLGISGFGVPFEAIVFACVCWYMLGTIPQRRCLEMTLIYLS